LDKEDLIIVLEALALEFQYYARKKDLQKTRKIYLLFEALSHKRTGRRSEWLWRDDELLTNRRSIYRDMLKTVSDQKEGLSTQPSDN